MPYFEKFPVIEYQGKNVRDITARVAFTAKSIASMKQYQPYVVPQGVRADELAHDYYNSPTQDWLLYLSNEIIDPYYGWPLESEVFNDYIIKKYGSINTSLEGIKHYRVNYDSDVVLNSVGYGNLTTEQKYYWTIDVVSSSNEVFYKRKPLQNTINTNKVQEVFLNNTEGLIVDERVKQFSGLTVVGSAQIAKIVNSSAILVEKVTGLLSNGNIQSNLSVLTKTITGVTTLSTNISDTISLYWTPVSYYEYESEVNDAKRNIFAIDASVQNEVDRAVTRLLNNE